MDRAQSVLTIAILFLSLLVLPQQGQCKEIQTFEEAQTLFDQLPGDLKHDFSTKCGDRAYIWSYLLKQKYDIDSYKLFLYFTPKSFKFTGMRWGFHVVTIVRILEQDYVIEKIPQYIITRSGDGYILKDELLYSTVVPLKAWLLQTTGYDSCKMISMKNPDDREVFKGFNSIRSYRESTENCIATITPSAYWWPITIYREVIEGNPLPNSEPAQGAAYKACTNVFAAKTYSERARGCDLLIGQPDSDASAPVQAERNAMREADDAL